MALNPKLTSSERIGIFVVGAGAAVYAAFGDYEKDWLRWLMVSLGSLFAFGGLIGT